VRELATGKEWPVYDNLTKDQQEAWTIFGVYTGFDWTPDDKNIIIWANGKIMNIQADGKKSSEIPFTASAKHTFMETVTFENKAFEDRIDIKVLRNVTTSPDGKKIVFSALGSLYVSENFSTPKRLFTGTDFEAEATFSPDGNTLVYVTWNDEEFGRIKMYDFVTKKTEVLAADPAIYR